MRADLAGINGRITAAARMDVMMSGIILGAEVPVDRFEGPRRFFCKI